MGRPIEIELDAKTRGAEQGMERTADAIDDLAKSLDKADDQATKTERTLDRDLTAALDDVKRKAAQTGDAMGDEIKRGGARASDGVEDLKNNTAQNAKEMGASFQDVGSAIDGLQGLAAEALEGFGPAGVAAGVAMAAGIGIAQQVLQGIADKVNEIKEQAGQLALAWRDATTTEQLQNVKDQWDELGQKIVDAKSWWEVWQDDARNTTDVLTAALDVDPARVAAFRDAFNMTDPIARQEALADALQDTTAEADRLDEQIAALSTRQQQAGAAARYGAQGADTWTDADTRALAAAKRHREVLDDLIPTMREQSTQADATAQQLESLAALEGLTVQQYKAKADAARQAADAQDAQRAADEAYASTVAGMATAQDVYSAAAERNREAIQAWADQHKVSFEEAQATWEGAPLTLDKVLDELSARVKARRDFEASLATLAYRGYSALADELRAGGPTANAATAALLAAGADDQVQRYATDQGYMLGKNLAQGAGDSVRGNAYLVNGALRDVERNLGPITVPVKVDTTAADQFFRNWRPDVTVVARVGKPAVV